jgi:hypothetical protein
MFVCGSVVEREELKVSVEQGTEDGVRGFGFGSSGERFLWLSLLLPILLVSAEAASKCGRGFEGFWLLPRNSLTRAVEVGQWQAYRL